jgi:hypothetical protein
VTCPGCGQAAEFQGYRPKTPLSLLGPVHCCRAYYCCHRCGQGRCPWDATAGLTAGRLTAGAERVVSLAGLLGDSFAEAAEKTLPELCGLDLGEATVRRTTEEAGRRLAAARRAGRTFGPGRPWAWHTDADGRTCAYVSVDATCVLQQAPGGGRAEGRMPYVAAVYNPAPPRAGADAPAEAPRPRMQARYLAGLYDLDELGLQLRRQAAQVGMEAAQVWIALSDGGNGLEGFLQRNFNRADLVVILDFWHAASYLEALARAWHPKDAEQSAALAQGWCHTLKHRGGTALLAALRGLALPRGNRAAREAHASAVGYLEKNEHRTDYPRYLAKGWEIGSGPVESACKTVVGQRLKLAGMRWREPGTDTVCHLRALYKSEPGQWDAFWNPSLN